MNREGVWGDPDSVRFSRRPGLMAEAVAEVMVDAASSHSSPPPFQNQCGLFNNIFPISRTLVGNLMVLYVVHRKVALATRESQTGNGKTDSPVLTPSLSEGGRNKPTSADILH